MSLNRAAEKRLLSIQSGSGFLVIPEFFLLEKMSKACWRVRLVQLSWKQCGSKHFHMETRSINLVSMKHTKNYVVSCIFEVCKIQRLPSIWTINLTHNKKDASSTWKHVK
jgi:hypothetical protein